MAIMPDRAELLMEIGPIKGLVPMIGVRDVERSSELYRLLSPMPRLSARAALR